jgi:type II secretory pathway component GspD/PulD (secretin)
MADVASLIEKLDSTESKQRRVEVIPVERADPASLTRALNDIYVSQQRGFFGTTPPITITEVSGSRSIMVKASDVDMAAIKETIALLDSEEGSSGGTIRVIPLLKSDATEVLNVMTEYLRKPGGGGGRRGGGGELVGDTRLSALTQSNALAVSGSETEVERIVGVIQQIDATGEMGRTPQLIRLEHANVADVVTTLQEVFTESRGRGGRGGTTQEPPVITANEALNMLVVRAGSADLTAIQEMVTALDTEDAAGAERVRILTVAPALNVTELAEKLETLFNTSLQQGPGSGTRSRGGRQERVSVSADTRTHSLLVSASPSVFKEIEATVRSLEEKGPQGGRSIRVLRPTNIKADEIQDLIERLREDSSGSSGSRTRGSRRRG